MKLDTSEIALVKNRLQHLTADNETVFWLDSCALPDAYHVGKYELLVGFGQKDQLECTSDQMDWNTLDGFIQKNDWKFFTLSYDLKNHIAGLSSENPDAMNWPVASFITPKLVVAITKTGELRSWGQPVEEVYKSLTDLPQQMQNHAIQYEKMTVSLSKDEHYHRVKKIKSEIAEGNMYEMNLCLEHMLHAFQCPDAFGLYQQLIQASPTPFSAYVRIGSKHVLCASPERFVATKRGRIYSQPIKGTSEKFEDYSKNQESRLHLANSIKERAEHIMIVDLVRNDLSKISKPGTVLVDELFAIYEYKQVNQMISTISGELTPGTSFIDIIKATYPMGSMTGAPKHIVMKFIEELEAASRGWYSGTIGYIDPEGNMDSNVVIRSLLYDSMKKLATFSVGGAITYDSDPLLEYEECQLKSSAIRSVLGIK